MTLLTRLNRYDNGEITMRKRTEPTLLLDGDLISYRTAASKEHPVNWGDGIWTLHSDEKECQLAVIQYIESVKTAANLDDVVIAFSDTVNFRKELNSEYKANRSAVRRPLVLKAVQEWMKQEFESVVYPRLEADDTMGILASAPDSPFIIVSDDKDMMTVPSDHFFPEERRFHTINLPQANQAFYTQAMTGDPTDNYKGVPNVGAKTAEKILAGSSFTDEKELWARVLASYLKAGLTEEEAVLNARMARILRHGEYDLAAGKEILWTPPSV